MHLVSDAAPTGVHDTQLLWVLIALASEDVALADVACVMGIPEGQVREMLAVAAVRGAQAVEYAMLDTKMPAPAVSLARTEDIQNAVTAIRAWVPESVMHGKSGLATSMRRLGKIVERSKVWTNN